MIWIFFLNGGKWSNCRMYVELGSFLFAFCLTSQSWAWKLCTTQLIMTAPASPMLTNYGVSRNRFTSSAPLPSSSRFAGRVSRTEPWENCQMLHIKHFTHIYYYYCAAYIFRYNITWFITRQHAIEGPTRKTQFRKERAIGNCQARWWWWCAALGMDTISITVPPVDTAHQNSQHKALNYRPCYHQTADRWWWRGAGTRLTQPLTDHLSSFRSWAISLSLSLSLSRVVMIGWRIFFNGMKQRGCVSRLPALLQSMANPEKKNKKLFVAVISTTSLQAFTSVSICLCLVCLLDVFVRLSVPVCLLGMST